MVFLKATGSSFQGDYNDNHDNLIYTGWPPPPKNGTVDTVDFSGLCSDQQSSFFLSLLDRASFPPYNNTKIVKFGGELVIL